MHDTMMIHAIFLIFIFSRFLTILSNSPLTQPDTPYIKGTFPQPYKLQNIADQCFAPGKEYKYKYEPCGPVSAIYRTYDGSCNNIKYPWWGMSYAPLVRLMPAHYSDDKLTPRTCNSGAPLPNARKVRLDTIKSKVFFDDLRYWTLLISWTQFVSHDTGHSTPKKDRTNCCMDNTYGNDPYMCMSMKAEADDPFYGNKSSTCINMVRGLTTDELGCPLTPVQQVTRSTHFMDCSPIYGSSAKVAHKLRLNRGGLLKSQVIDGYEYPPNHGRPRSICDIPDKEPAVCYYAGDSRINQNPFIAAIQILLLRMHNKFAREFAVINPHWDDERLYQEARRCLIGIVQWITYEEVLPVLLGNTMVNNNYLKTNDHTDKYHDHINPSTVNEFQTAAYRALHSMIPPTVWLLSHQGGVPTEVNLVQWMQRPSLVQGYFDQVLEGLQTQFIQPQDTYEDFNINNKMKAEFPPFNYNTFGEDLGAITIQRQRDYGMPSYNEFRKYAGLKNVSSFEELGDAIDPQYIAYIKQSYAHVNDIDLFVGGYLERPHGDSLFGPTFSYVIAEQFYRWKFGDRYFFSFLGNPWSFTKAQYNEIIKTTTGWLFCEGGNEFHWVHINNINNAILGNQLPVPCDILPKFDYSKWKEGGSKKSKAIGFHSLFSG